MAEYIEREALIENLSLMAKYQIGERQQGILGVIQTIKMWKTADVVEVVRCSDCEHFTEGMAIGMCKRVVDKPIIPIPYNHYCSFGVKRTEKQDDKVCK